MERKTHCSIVDVEREELVGMLLEVVLVLPVVGRLVQVQILEMADRVRLRAKLLHLVTAHRGADTTPRPEHPPPGNQRAVLIPD